MRIIYGLNHLKGFKKKPIVAIGVFDGLHRGHMSIIAGLLKQASKSRTNSLIVTFWPHPQKESSLYSLPHRLKLIEETGVDLCLVIKFGKAFRAISAQHFLETIISRKINPAVLFIGKNFTFGRNAEGDWRMLRDYSHKAKFILKVVDVLTHKGRPVSSSYIRVLIKSGNLARAEELLGRPVALFGRVIKGSRLGRLLGFPTANISPEHEIIPPFGIYAVRVKIINRSFRGICYIGSKPTVGNAGLYKRHKRTPGQPSIEVHIFDFKKALYGQRLEIEFIKKIRSQKRFNSLESLARQIKRDIRTTINSASY